MRHALRPGTLVRPKRNETVWAWRGCELRLFSDGVRRIIVSDALLTRQLQGLGLVIGSIADDVKQCQPRGAFLLLASGAACFVWADSVMEA